MWGRVFAKKPLSKRLADDRHAHLEVALAEVAARRQLDRHHQREVAAADPAAITRTMSRYDQSRTALHLAVMKNRPAVVRALLELGADP